MKIKHKQEVRWGSKMKLPVLGLTEIPKNGEIEVDDEVAEMLFTTNNWTEVIDEQKSIKLKSESEKQALSENEAKLTGYITSPDTSVGELVDIALNANLNAKQYDKIKEDHTKMVEFLLKNIKTISKAVNLQD